MLLILASPHVLLEPSGAGARPVHPIHVISLRCGIWPLSGQYRTLATERPEDYGFTAFCNGPDEVKSPSDCHAAELL